MPIGMMYRTTSYAEGALDVFWFEKNLQGDIVAVYNDIGIIGVRAGGGTLSKGYNLLKKI